MTDNHFQVNRTISSDTKLQWIVPLALQLIPGILLLGGMFFCPESPRYYVKKDNLEQASKTLSWIRQLPEDDPYILRELEEIRAQTAIGRPPPGVKYTKSYYFKRLFQVSLRPQSLDDLNSLTPCRKELVTALDSVSF